MHRLPGSMFVYMPKNEGGLGLRRLTPWNKTMCLRLVWLLISNTTFLWSQWHKKHNLREVSFWEIEESPANSWTWKMLLQLRPLAQKFIKSIVGNGLKTSFWFDQWTFLGPLINLLSSNGPRSTGIPITATVTDMCNSYGWKLRAPRSKAVVTLHTYLATILIPSEVTNEDSTGWFGNDSSCNGFSTSKTCEEVRPRQDKKDWSDLVWYKGSVPKHAFYIWFSNLNI